MRFCPNCENILHPDEGRLVCHNCNFYVEGILESSEKMKEKEKIGVGVVDGINIFADYDFECMKCGFNKAQVIERGPEFSDEDSITMLKCGKCGNVKDLTRKKH